MAQTSVRVDDLSYPLFLWDRDQFISKASLGRQPYDDLRFCKASLCLSIVYQVRLSFASFVKPDPEPSSGFCESQHSASFSEYSVVNLPGLLRGMMVTADRVQGLSSILSAASPVAEKVASSSVWTLRDSQSLSTNLLA